MNTSDVLDGAADLIERDGWCRHHRRLRGAHCVLGAIGQVEYGDSHTPLVHSSATTRALERWVDHPHVYMWNDVQEDAAVVTSTLRACAATERAREASPVRVVAETQDVLPESVRS